MRKKLPVALALAALLPALSYAQQPPDPLAVVSSFLELSPDQTARLAQGAQALAGMLHQLEQAMREKEQELATLADAPAPDPTAVGHAFVELRAMGRQREAAIAGYHAAVHDLLTPPQLEKLQTVSLAASLVPILPAFAALRLVVPPSL